MAVEIEVIGGYDEPFDVDLPPRPLPATVARSVRGFTSREQLSDSLRRLPDDCPDVQRPGKDHGDWRNGHSNRDVSVWVRRHTRGR